MGVRADGARDRLGLTNGEGGTRGAEAAEFFRASQLQEEKLPALDGIDMGVNFPDLSEKQVLMLLAVDGLSIDGEIAGDKALRKSVYAVGGVMGVRKSLSSCLIKSCQMGRGLRGSSEGRTGPAEHGVLRVGRTGFTPGDLTIGDAEGMAACEDDDDRRV